MALRFSVVIHSRITGPRTLPKRGAGLSASSADSKAGFKSACTIGLVVRCQFSFSSRRTDCWRARPCLPSSPENSRSDGHDPRPHPDSITEPLSFPTTPIRCLPVLRESAGSHSGCGGKPRMTSLPSAVAELILWSCSLCSGRSHHAFTSAGISMATARRSSVRLCTQGPVTPQARRQPCPRVSSSGMRIFSAWSTQQRCGLAPASAGNCPPSISVEQRACS
jgi:hypothetical protein